MTAKGAQAAGRPGADDPWPPVRDLESVLGDPRRAGHPLSYARVVEEDEAEAFPAAACARLHELGYTRFASPEAWEQGRCGFDALLEGTRAVARRDLTTAIVLGQSLLGSLPVLLSGSPEQRQRLSRHVASGRLGCLALTEEAHGGDLAATELLAAQTPEGLSLSGTKWLIGNARRSASITLLARREGEADPAGGGRRGRLVLLFLERAELGAQSYQCLPRLRTLGVRGADLGGLCFERCAVPATAQVGGDGFELILKTLQISRALCAGLSLGAGDAALRLALDFARERRLFGRTVAEIDAARAELVASFVDLLVCEAVALLAHRAIGAAPEWLCVWSAIAKSFVPRQVDALVARCAGVLGARHYLRSGHGAGVFQKIVRDHAVVGVFDGSTAVNRSVLAAQLPALAAARARRGRAIRRPVPSSLLGLLHLDAPCSADAFPPASALRISTDGGEPVIDALPGCLALVDADGGRLAEPLLVRLRELLAEQERIDRRVLELRRARAFDPTSREAARLAERSCAVFAAAVCTLLWLANRAGTKQFVADGEWLLLALDRLAPLGALRSADDERAAARLFELHAGDQSFSLRPRALAGAA